MPKKTACSPVEAWFKKHKKAREFVELWMEMIEAAESRVGLRKLTVMLQEDYGFPFCDPTGLGRRLKDMYGDRYIRAQATLNGRRVT